MVEKYQVLFWTVATLCVTVTVAFFMLGFWVNRFCYLGLLSIVPLGFTGYRIHGCLVTHRLLGNLRKLWGKEQSRECDRGKIARAYDHLSRDTAAATSLDDTTWSDLNMDAAFAKIDRAFTEPGAVVLYETLRQPEVDINVLQERGALIQRFQADSVLRENVQLPLFRLGRNGKANLAAVLWGEQSGLRRLDVFSSALAFLALLCLLVSAILSMKAAVFTVMPIFAVNLVVSQYVFWWKIAHRRDAIRHLGQMIECARQLGRLDHPDLADQWKELRHLAFVAAPIRRDSFTLMSRDSNRTGSLEALSLLYEYLSAYFLIEVRALCRVMKEIDRHRAEIQRLYHLVGELDCAQSVASFREGLPHYTEPELVPDEVSLTMADGQHPLLSNAVANSIAVASRGVFVSGSNMSGKSTFLRTVAVNAILAQTIYTCFATRYRACPFVIVSSINHADELAEDKSYYLVEAERILRIVRLAEGAIPCLCVVDELLRGTNSTERLSASLAILEYLSSRQALVLVSSHDTELAYAVTDRFDNYHFTDELSEEGLRFDYRLRKGIGSTRNAIRLLEFLGYPGEIVRTARQRLRERPA